MAALIQALAQNKECNYPKSQRCWDQVPSSAIVALLRKCYLTSGRNSGEGPATAAGAIGITLAYLCLILKHGRYNFTAIGNFATMFHINVPLKDFADGRWMYL